MPRRITILTAGTLGDVSPMAALGRALVQQGYKVSVAAPDNYRTLIESMGLEARRCGSDFTELMRDDEAGAIVGARTLRQLISWRFPGPKVREMFEGVLRDAAIASADADAIIFHPYILIAADIAESRKIPAILVPLGLMSPTPETPLALLASPTNSFWNRISRGLLRQQRTGYARTINDIRKKMLGLGHAFRFKHPHKVRGQHVTSIYPISSALAPASSTINEDVHFTGYWFRDDEPHWQPSPRLAEFLSQSPKPIYIGFGSMPDIGKDRVDMLLAACEAAGQRAVLGKGWGGFQDAGEGLSDNFRVLGYAPHLNLFREVSAVIHHGGLGTTSAGLMAGKPTLVCPFLVDQPYWGHRVNQIGAGPKPLPVTEWTLDSLTASIRDLVSNPLYKQGAADAAERMRHDGGTMAAARIVRNVIGAP